MWRRYLTKERTLPIIGICGFIHELLIHEGTERPWILGFCAALVGLRWTLPYDKKGGDE